MPTRWISVRPSPIAIGANPFGARPSVAVGGGRAPWGRAAPRPPEDETKKKKGRAALGEGPAPRRGPPGGVLGVAFGGNPPAQAKAGLPAGDPQQPPRPDDPADHL